MKRKHYLLDLMGGMEDRFVMEAMEDRAPVRSGIRKNRVLLIAAVVALTALLVGCGVVCILRMESLKLADCQATEARWDEHQKAMVQEVVDKQLLTFASLKGTANYEAAGEWYRFLQAYDPDHARYHENKNREEPYEAPEEYCQYNIYTPEMREKLDALLETYGLKLKGKPVRAFHTEALFAYLGVEGALLPEAEAVCETFNASYYDGGWFHVDMDMTLPGEADWPYQFLCSLYVSPKDCFENAVCELNSALDWREWNYTTASGTQVLVIFSPSASFSWVFCDREDAAITLRLETIVQAFGDDGLREEAMTVSQVKKVLDSIDFSIAPVPGDPALLEGPAPDKALTQTQNGCTVGIKEVYTDGLRTEIRLVVSAPEGTDLEGYLEMEQVSGAFAETRFAPAQERETILGGMTGGLRADDDGKANTMEYEISLEQTLEEGVPYEQGSAWTLYLEDLAIRQWDRESLRWQSRWEAEGVWHFALSLDQGDWREVEFLEAPIVTSLAWGCDADGNDVFRDVTLTSLRLRTLGGSYVSGEEGSLDFSNTREGKYPTVVLKDGRTIRLTGDLRIYDPDTDGSRIPLEKIDHLLLTDGTKLYPQK